jgi:hypothetical protein
MGYSSFRYRVAADGISESAAGHSADSADKKNPRIIPGMMFAHCFGNTAINQDRNFENS